MALSDESSQEDKKNMQVEPSSDQQPTDGAPAGAVSGRHMPEVSSPTHQTAHAHAKPAAQKRPKISPEDAPFLRAENEDDDGYDPYSDRLPHPEPLFERDPWD
ncbi:MAG: hypothetical protein ACI360_03435 [Atopobiaceae bacterium]